MDWFEKLTGFRETGYVETRGKLSVEKRRLKSLINGKSYGIGELELVSLETLRQRVKSLGDPSGRLKVSIVTGDVREMHQRPEYAGALFQVASQFNLLEMTGPSVTPEDGVTIYQHDRTQGPACAIAAGAATIYRNYFAEVNGAEGQTRDRQFDGLADFGASLSTALGEPLETLWEMRNGYALCSRTGLDKISEYLRAMPADQIDILRGKLRIGLHSNVEVTDAIDQQAAPLVSQAFCSALPVACSRVPAAHWKEFASLVLEAAYEATMWSAVLNAQQGVANVVLLTTLGGGAFGNDEAWINGALRRALEMMTGYGLEVRLVCFGAPTNALAQMLKELD
jgi:hypothetical protein